MVKITTLKIEILILLQIIILITLRFFYIILGGPEYITSTLTNDDSYYYFNTAWNTKINGFVTFDSFHKTNGVHFLWFWIVYLLSFLTNSKEIYLIIILLFNTIIMGISFVPIWKIGKKIKNEYFALILSMIWFTQLLIFDTFFMGMENTIHNIIILYIILYLIKILNNNEKLNRDFLILSFLLIINIWVRYDSVIIAGIVYIIVFIYFFLYKRKLSFNIVLISFFLIIVGTMILFLGFYLMGGTFIPISAKIKLYSTQNTDFERYLNNIFVIITPYIFFKDLTRYDFIISLIIALLFAFINLKFLIDLIRKKKNYAKLKYLILILSFSNLIYSLIIGMVFDSYYVWYLSLSFIIWTIIFSYILNIVIFKFSEKIKNYKKVNISKYFEYNKIIKFGALIFLFISIPCFIALKKSPYYNSDEYDKNFYFLRYKTAIWLKNNTNHNDIIGSWNAGQIAFFSNRKVINLDGLINDNDYFNTILSNVNKFNSSEFVKYLNEMNISYIVDYKFYGFHPSYSNYSLIKEFTYDGLKTPMQIWVRQH